MTNGEILEKAIRKAVDSGYNLYNIGMLTDEAWEEIAYKNYEVFLFNTNFAKAFWGIEYVDDMGRNLDQSWEELWKDEGQHFDKDDFENDFGFDVPTQIAWEFHLQKIVILKGNSRFKYIERFL